MDPGATHGVHSYPDAFISDYFHINDLGKRVNERSDEVLLKGGIGRASFLIGRPPDIRTIRIHQLIGPVLYPSGYIHVSRTALRRVVFETAILGWIMGWGNHHTVGEPLFSSLVVSQYQKGNDWGGGVFVIGVDNHVHVIRSKNLQGCPERGF